MSSHSGNTTTLFIWLFSPPYYLCSLYWRCYYLNVWLPGFREISYSFFLIIHISTYLFSERFLRTFFIKIWPTYYKIHPFNLYIQWFLVCSELCYHSYYILISEYFHHVKKRKWLLIFPSTSPWQISTSVDLPVLDVS